MWRLSATLVVALLLSLKASGKSVRGVFRSEAARQENGQFITKFMYQAGDGGLLVCRLDNPSLGTEKEARLLLYQDMDSDLDNLSCSQRLSRAQFTISLSQDEHNQTIPRQSSPTAWQVLYADRYTCEVTGNVSCFHGHKIQIQPLGRGNIPVVCFLVRKAQQLTSSLRFCVCCRAVWDMVSQVSMLYMLLSLCMGWTLSRGRKPQSRPLQWERSPASTAVAVGGVVTQGVLLLWEQYSESESEHHSYHAQRSLAGLLLLALRVALSLLLASVLYQIVSTERSTLKRDFYLCFAKGCFLWFLCHPVLVLMSVVFNDHQREKVITIGVILCQSISMVILYQLFLSRSLYWEVSSLSSVSLPLTMSRTNHRGRL
uniref:Uncharacterized protein n=1 Tax=Xiphophorus couchianus TaxID=32473 RepID=A0A3B5N172_9TELE